MEKYNSPKLSRRYIFIVIALLLLIGSGVYLFSDRWSTESNGGHTPISDEVENDADVYVPISRIDAVQMYEDGEHTVRGEVALPTPCDEFSVEDVLVRGSNPEHVILAFSITRTADVCAQVVTPRTFEVMVDAAREATFDATVNGQAVELNLVPTTNRTDAERKG